MSPSSSSNVHRTTVTDSVLSEIPLSNGRLTPGILRIGDTVRRPSKSSSRFVSLLLMHLEAKHFAGAPRYLGQDEYGRDILTYIPGWVPIKFQYFADDQIRAAGGLLGALHDATRNSILAGDNQVVCHHDVGPNNVVFRDNRPVAFIDFDLAAPGEPLEDLGYMAWTWCLSSKVGTRPVAVQAAQVRILVEGYGLDLAKRREVIDAMLERQSRNVKFWIDRRDDSSEHLERRDQIDARIQWSQRELAYTHANRATFEAALF